MLIPTERLVPEEENILLTLVDWGSDLEDVRFYLRCREPSILPTGRTTCGELITSSFFASFFL